MLSASVTGHFDRHMVERMVDQLARDAVAAGVRTGGATARAVARQRVQTGRTSDIVVGPVEETPTGYRAEFASPTKNAWYQSDGTLANRRKDKPKRTPRSPRAAKPGSGVTPLFFLDLGLRAGSRAMLRVALGGPAR